MKIGISDTVAKSLGITEDTVFEVYYENGCLFVSALSEEESAVIMRGVEEPSDDEEYGSFQEAYEDGLDDGRVEGYEAGYRRGYSHCLDGKPYDQDYPGDEVLTDELDCKDEDCTDCEYYCAHCDKCVLEEQFR